MGDWRVESHGCSILAAAVPLLKAQCGTVLRSESIVERAVKGEARIAPVWPILNAHALQQSFKARARNARHMAFRLSSKISQLEESSMCWRDGLLGLFLA